MNGAEALIKTALRAGVDVCFANPGTTEMPLVAALDSVPGMRAVLNSTDVMGGPATITTIFGMVKFHDGPLAG